MNKEIYEKIKNRYPQEINIINMLCLAPQGLFLYDLYRIILMAEQSDRKHAIEFGQWREFI